MRRMTNLLQDAFAGNFSSVEFYTRLGDGLEGLPVSSFEAVDFGEINHGGSRDKSDTSAQSAPGSQEASAPDFSGRFALQDPEQLSNPGMFKGNDTLQVEVNYAPQPEMPSVMPWPDTTVTSEPTEHFSCCGCVGCMMKREELTFSEGLPPNSSGGESAPAILGDMADFLTQGYWSGVAPRFHNVTSTGIDPNNGTLHFNVSGYSSDPNGLSTARADLVREAFKLFEATLGINFVETTSTNTSTVDFFFGDNDSGAYAGSSYYSNGEIHYSYINVATSWSGGTSTYDDYTLQTILHEIGHALGLGHQGAYNGSATYGIDNTFENDSWQASMMSYFSQTENTTITADYAFLQTPMAVDWMALDDLYGSQGYGVSNAFLGDTVYGFNTNITSAVSDIWAQFATYADVTASTIVDGGGIDTLDLSGYSNNTVINLAPSDRGSTAPSISDIGGLVGNLTIGEGTIIENAIGGAGGETFYGNVADNTFTGNGGSDHFYDSQGTDTYYGGAGTDYVYFGLNFSAYTFAVVNAFLQVTDPVIDWIEDTVEWLVFADQTLSYQAVAATVPTNTPPVAQDDGFATDEETSVSGNLFNDNGNGVDSDGDGDGFTVSQVNGSAGNVGSQITLASGALLTVGTNGALSYDPNGAFDVLNDGQSGSDSFTYEIDDGNGGTDTATVTITIDGLTPPPPPNTPPVAQDDDFTTDEETSVSGNLFSDNGNGVDSDGDGDVFTVSQVNGSAGNVGSQITLASGALLTVGTNGSLNYDPNGAFDSLEDGQSGSDSFTYEIDDGNSGTDTATVTITIDGITPPPPNTPPVAQDDGFATDEETSVSGNLFNDNGNGVDSDGDGDSFTITEVNGSAGNVGSQITLASGALLTVGANGSLNYDPNGAFDALNDGQSGSDSFTYEIDDGNGGSDTATVTVTIDGITAPPPPNTPPVAQDDGFATDEDTSVSGNLFSDNGNGIDSDGDGDSFTITEVNGSAGNVGSQITLASGALLTVGANGSLSYDPNGAFDALNDGQSDSDSFTYEIDDGNGGTDTATVTITIDGITPNTPPVAQDDGFITDEETSISGNLFSDNGNGVDSDGDGDVFTVSQVNGSAGNVGSQITLASGALLTVGTNGSLNYDPNGAFDALNDGQSGSDSFTYEIDDGNGGTDTATVTINVDGITPVVIEETTATIDFEGDPTGPYPGDFGLDFSGLNVISYTGIGGSKAGASGADGSFSVTAAGEDFDLNGIAMRAVGSYNYIQATAYDDGVQVGSTWQFIYGHVASTVTFDDSFDDIDQVVFSVYSGGEFYVDNIQLTAWVEVGPPNIPPVAQDDGFTTDEETSVSGNLFSDNGNGVDSDGNGDSFTVSAVNGSAGNVGSQITLASGALLTVGANGSLNYDPNGAFDSLEDGQSDSDSFTYEIDDGNGGTDTATVTITIDGITPPNTPPVAQDDDFTTDEETSVSGNLFSDNGNGVDSDGDGDSFTITEVNGAAGNVGSQITLASGALLTVGANGALSYDPNGVFDALNDGQSDTDSFTYEIDDGNGGTDTATVTITIDGITPNTPPVAQDDSFDTDEETSVSGNLFSDNGNGVDSDGDGDSFTVSQVNGSAANVGSQITLASGALLTVGTNGSLSYDPNGAFDGLEDGQSDSDSFTYEISDGNGGTDTATVTINIDGITPPPPPPNTPPVAQDDDFTTDEATSVSGNLFSNNGNGVDSDGDGDSFTITEVNGSAGNVGSQITLASGALLTVGANGALSYDPNGAFDGLNNGQSGSDSFTYEIDDGNGGSDTATVTINIDGITPPPPGSSTPVTIDFEGEITGPYSGEAGLSFSGLDVINYAGIGGARAGSTNATGTFTITATGEDFDLDGISLRTPGYYKYVQVTAYDDSAQVGSTWLVTNGAQATITAFSAAFDDIDQVVFSAYGGGGFFADDIQLTTNGGAGPSNAPPVARDDDFNTDEETTVSGNLFNNNGNGIDSDGDGDSFTVTEINGSAGNVGSQITLASGALLTVGINGTLSYDPNGAFDALFSGQSDSDSFTYEIDDGNGGTDTATVTISIDGIGAPPPNTPPVAQDDDFTTDEETSVSGNLFSNNGNGVDSDGDGHSFTVTEVNGSASNVGSQITLTSGALLTVGANGSLSYDPNGAFDSLEDGQSDTDSFTYEIDDGNGGTDTATVTINIDGITPPPVGSGAVTIDFESEPSGSYSGVPGLDFSGLDVIDYAGLSGAKAGTSGTNGNFTITAAGDDFDLNGISLRTPGSYKYVQATAYDDGAQVGSTWLTASGTQASVTTFGSEFDSVDQVVFGAYGGGEFYVDDILTFL